MPGPEQNKKTHNEQIEEARRNAQPPFQPTDYTGLKLDNKIADQIAQQPASELLTFERVGDKTRIQAKLPEKGYDPNSGKEYNIRINMNYLARGLARAAMNEDGSIDSDKLDELDDLKDQITGAGSDQQLATAKKNFIDRLGIPPEDRENFERFFDVNADPFSNLEEKGWERTGKVLLHSMYSPVNHMVSEVQTSLAPFKYAAEGGEIKEEGSTKEGREAKLRECERDYKNLCETYRLMAEMDPKQETRILYPMDCDAFKTVTSSFVEQNNALRQKEGKPLIRTTPTKIEFGDQQEDPQNHIQRSFDEHHLIAVEVKLKDEDGKEHTNALSLENTAPPSNRLLHRPGVERTGVGLFENAEAIEAYHRSNNLVSSVGEEDRRAIKGVHGSLRRMHFNFSPQVNDWEAEAFHARELGKSLTDREKVIDCFARHMAAQSVAESNREAAKPTKYGKKLMDKAVKELKGNRDFKLMAQTCSTEKMRKALAAPDPQAACIELYAPQPGKRYPASDSTRERLNALGEIMTTKGRSPEWVTLHDALADPNMKDTSKIFDAVEAYTKGKKSVRKTQEGRESFDLAMTALAIAAKDGDPAARQRAQNLVDRINEVRGSQDAKHRDHVSLDAYAPREVSEQEKQQQAEREAQEAKLDEERLAKDAQDPTRAEKNQKFLDWLGKQQNMSQTKRANAEQYMTDHPGVREEARKIAEKRGLDVDIPQSRQQPEKQQPEKQEPAREQPKGPELGG